MKYIFFKRNENDVAKNEEHDFAQRLSAISDITSLDVVKEELTLDGLATMPCLLEDLENVSFGQ